MVAMQKQQQHTLSQAVHCTSVGLHTGQMVRMVLRPAPANHGIVFVRTDVPASQSIIPARYDLVTETRLGTVITNEHGTSVSTIEHLMAALWGCGVDNLIIEVDAPEVPIMDGSSEPFIELIESVEVIAQNASRKAIQILKPVTIQQGESIVTLEPHDGFAIDIDIEFNHAAIARQHASYDFARMTFKDMLSSARTFGFEHEVEYLRSIGLARGGSLENAIVIGKEGVLNPEGLRYNDEFVRHKALDCIGDLFLAGASLLTRVVARRPGHSINNAILRALFADPTAWKLADMPAHATISASNPAIAHLSIS